MPYRPWADEQAERNRQLEKEMTPKERETRTAVGKKLVQTTYTMGGLAIGGPVGALIGSAIAWFVTKDD